MAYASADIESSKQFESRPVLQSTIAGSSDAELKLFAVMPNFGPFVPRAVNMVTPVAKLPRVFRKSVVLKSLPGILFFL